MSERQPTAKIDPIIMLPGEAIPLKSAAVLMRKSIATVRRWVKLYGIGSQSCPNAPIDISLPALLMAAAGEADTIERLRAGERDHPRVALYLRSLKQTEPN